MHLAHRVNEWIDTWHITVERAARAGSSAVIVGRRGDLPVVLKVLGDRGDEWRSAEILDCFEGRGTIRVYERAAGAMLLERAIPGVTAASLVAAGRDDDATGVLAEVMRRMSARTPAHRVATVDDWGASFDGGAAGSERGVPRSLVDPARRIFRHLCRSQRRVRLLHGDLHHDNVILDDTRGWLAIDPKGVIGELEYEVGAALRNPHDRPDLFADPPTIQRRAARFARELNVDAGRLLAWGFAQAVLSAIWQVEDDGHVDPQCGVLRLADTLRPMLTAVG